MDDDLDDLDDLDLNARKAELEARFQEMEREAEIERMRREAGAPPPAGRDPAPEPAAASERSEEDPLSRMKAVLDTDGDVERHLLVVCPHCAAKNRMSLRRVRTAKPICGRCKKDLSVIKV